SGDATRSHRRLEQYAGTSTWVLGVDGDELYDPGGLAKLREALSAGTWADVFRLKAHVLNCETIDHDSGMARGFMAPPSPPLTKLFTFQAIDSWRGGWERLHGPPPVFRPGYDWDSWRTLAEETAWETDPLRALHVAFLRRSSRDGDNFGRGRRNLPESGMYRRG